MAKVGRNDLCPCGSGKKYKKCCLVLDSIADPRDSVFDQYNNLLIYLKTRLEEAYAQDIRKVRTEAKQIFLQYTTNDNLPVEQESIFSDWLWFDKTDSAGDTLGFYYLQNYGVNMDPALSSALTALSLSYLSVYEILDSQDEHLLIKDIFSNLEAKVLIKEPYISTANELLLGRLLFLPEVSIFSGQVLIMENTDERKEYIINHYNYLKETIKDSVANLFKFHGNMILGLFDHAYQKQMVNLNDIRYAAITPETKTQLITALDKNPDIAPLYNIADYQWYSLLSSDKGYIRIAVSEDNIILCADILEDIYYLSDLINDIIPELEFTIVSSNFVPSPPTTDNLPIWFTVVKDQEAEKWLKTPMQDLHNQTPLEAIAQAEGKKELLKMLRALEGEDNTTEQAEFLAYIQARVNEF